MAGLRLRRRGGRPRALGEARSVTIEDFGMDPPEAR
jgi:hypothetical protein